MTMPHLIALLDPPSEESFGMVPFAVRTFGAPTVSVHGLAGKPQHVIGDDELHHLIMAGHAADLSAYCIMLDAVPEQAVAVWLGKVFQAKLEELKAPIVATPTTNYPVKDGLCWVASAEQAYNTLLRWSEAAAKQAVYRNDAHLADLTMWALPQHLDAQAAVWHTRRTDKERERLIQLHVQVYPEPRQLGPKRLQLAYEGYVAYALRAPV